MRAARRSRQSALVLVDDRQRSYDTLGSRGDPRGSGAAISEKLRRLEGVGEAGGGRMTRLEQRSAFVTAAAAVLLVAALLIWVLV